MITEPSTRCSTSTGNITSKLCSQPSMLLSSTVLVRELGFTAIALETGFLDSIVADDYIQGDKIDRDSAARAVFSWSHSAYAENRELVEWLKRHNATQSIERRIRLYGLEILSCGEFDGRWPVEASLAFAMQVDSGAVTPLRQRLAPLLSLFNEVGYEKASRSEQDSLLGVLHDLASLYELRQVDWIARTSSLAYQRAYRQIVVAGQLLAYLRAGGEGRDVAAAQNLRWVLEREGPRGRVFVFAHNGHLAKRAPHAKVRHTIRSPMGELLRDSLGDDMVVIGSLFDRGTGRELFGLYGPVNSIFSVQPSAPDSLNGMLATAGPAQFVLDLRMLRGSGNVERWFQRPANVRHVAGYNAYDVPASFDALIFVRNISPQKLVRADVPPARDCVAGERSR